MTRAATASRFGLSLLFASCLVLVAPHASAAPAISDEAKTHFVAGVNLLRDPAHPRYEEAYREFKAAYALSPSYKILGNVALCAMKLERDEEAIAAYEKYLSEAVDLDPAEREQIERDLQTLRATMVKLSIDGVPTGGTLLDTRIPTQGEAITNAYGPVEGPTTTFGIRRGHHVLRARVTGRPEAVWEFDADGGQLAHTFEIPPAPAPTSPAAGTSVSVLGGSAQAERPQVERPIPVTVWAAGGATLALLGSSLVVGAVASGKRSDFDAVNDGSDVHRAEDLRSQGRSLNVVSDVLLAGAVVGAAVTTYFFLTRPAVQRASASQGLAPGFPFAARF